MDTACHRANSGVRNSLQMASENQIAANRVNAQQSTGPRTPDGKAASSRNAVTHGLTAKNIVPCTESEKIEFRTIHESAYAEWKPVGSGETFLVDRIVYSRCNLLRVTRLLGELETGTLDDVLDPEYAKPIARLNRYYAMHERSLYRALRALKAEQTNRALRDKALGAARPVPVLADFSKLNRKQTSHPSPARQVPPTASAPPR